MQKALQILRYFFYGINVIAIICTFVAAFGGYISPIRLHAIPAIAAMTFPAWFIAMPVFALISFFVNKKYAIANIATMLLCINAFLTYCPLNFFSVTPPTGSREIKVMSYNVLHYKPYKPKKYSSEFSYTISAIINSGADIVCVPEGILPEKLSRRISNATSEQLDSLCNIYPYRVSDTEGISTLSKFPVKMTSAPEIPGESGNLQVFQYDIDGIPLKIYNIHLQSFGFNPDDKELFIDLTEGKTDNNIRRSKNQLLNKLATAFRCHATQAQIIRSALDKDDAKNVILCGDFNDIPGCYALRTICGEDMYDCFRECALGPSISYRDNRFYFHIDQMLCRKGITTTDIKPLRIGASDHFPILATVHITK